MMQSTDTATQSPYSPEAQVVEGTQVLSAVKDDRLSLLLSQCFSEVPYAVKLLAISSTVGMSAILLGQGLRQPDTRAAHLPTPEDMGVNRPSLPSLRDRVSVTTLRSAAVSPPESLPFVPVNANRQYQLQSSAELPTVRISHGFDHAGQPSLAAALPVPTLPVPTLPPSPTPALIAVEPQAAPAPKQIPIHPANTDSTDSGAIVPWVNSPVRQTVTERDSSQAVPAQATPPAVRPTPEPLAPTTFPAPAASIRIASATRLTALEPTRGLQGASYVKPLMITGNTRFSSKELVEVVQKAIAARAERLSASDQPLVNRNQSALLQASEAVTQFYAAHSYTNVAVDVSTAAFNGGTLEIHIVEDPLAASQRLALPNR